MENETEGKSFFLDRMIKNVRENLVLSLVVNLFFAFTLIIYGPYEIFILNSVDFDFTLRDVWWMPVLAALLYMVVSVVVCSLMPKKLCIVCNQIVFSFTLCCYIQALFLNRKLISFAGETLAWSSGTIYGNLVIWGGIFALVFFLSYLLRQNWSRLMQGISLALVCMQAVSLVFMLITTDVLTEQKTGYLSARNMLELSGEDNVLVFILDFFDERTLNRILNEDPDFLKPMDGFTYFPDATSVYSRTYPSITYLLTGEKCYFDKEPVKWINEADANGDFISALTHHGIDVGIYTDMEYVGNGTRGVICNFEPDRLRRKPLKVIIYFGKMILYRDMPYILKERFEYSAEEINNYTLMDGSQEDSADNPAEKYCFGIDEWVYEKIKSERFHISEKGSCFRFYHLAGPHMNLSDDRIGGRLGFEIVYACLEQLRELGIYDQSTVIVTTDHGYSGAGDTLDMPHETAVPIMFVKPKGESGGGLKISQAPVSQTEFIPTVLNAFDISCDAPTVFDISENEKRERYYYYTALYSDTEGEIELREYLVDGDARDKNNYHFTGQKWDVLYSMNKVAGK